MIWYSEKRENSELQRIIEEGSDGSSSKSSLDIQLRFLTPYDIDEVRLLCEESFPIEYPLSWYEDITSNSTRFYSLAAIYNCAIVGLIVAEIKSWSKLNKEDKTILSENLGRSSSLAYILSLGVHQKYRRNGIASVLLQSFTEHLQGSEQNSKIKAIYLHVLTTNQPAIVFYERYNFILHSFLPYYYSIKGKSRDGFCYVSYINGGHAPYHFIDQVKDLFYNVVKFNFVSWIVSRCRLMVNWFNYHAFSKIHFRQ